MRVVLQALVLVFSFVLSGQTSPDCFNDESMKKEDSSLVKITRLKCNSEQPDFSPILFKKQLYFVSGRNNVAGLEYKDNKGNSAITDIYLTPMKDSVRSGKCVPLPGLVNSKYYEGPFSISASGDMLFYTTNTKDSPNPRIYLTQKVDGQWTTPSCLPFCKDTFSYCHPALSKTGDTLWFSSNKPGGYGKMDLYFSTKAGDTWTDPINAGARINTSASEAFPFIAYNTHLYFSSDREGGYGGLDLYMSPVNDGAGSVSQLSPPFNSPFDDFGVWLDSTLEQGYFSSNRYPRTKDDIFQFANPLPDFDDAVTYHRKKRFCFTFFEENTQVLNDTANFEFEWDFGDGHKSRGIRSRHCYEGPGRYQVQLNMVQKVSGETFMSQASYPLVIDTVTYVGILSPDSAGVNNCVELQFYTEGFKNYKVDKVVWSFGDGKFNEGRSLKHIYRKPGTYKISLWVLARDVVENKIQKIKAEKEIWVRDVNQK